MEVNEGSIIYFYNRISESLNQCIEINADTAFVVS